MTYKKNAVSIKPRTRDSIMNQSVCAILIERQVYVATREISSNLFAK